MVHVSRSPSGTHWEAVSRRTVAPRQVVPVSDQEDVSVFLGFGGGAAHPELGLMAVSREPGVFQVWHAKGTSRIALPEGARAVGVSVNLRRGEAGMIALEGDGRTLLQVGQAWTRRLQRAAAPVDHVAVSPAASSLAYSTTAGELVIFALERDSVLYQASPTG
jgi:hypothetical protein